MFGNYIPFDPYFVIFGFITLFSFVYSFYGIKQPVIFGEKIQLTEDDKSGTESEKYIRSGLKNDQAEVYLQKLIKYVESEKPYLNRDLSIHDLSQLTGIPRHYITQILNEHHGKSFFLFINEYRVKEVLERFEDPKNSSFTILAIAYDSGFNSKTTFNSFFKSQTGMTPSKCRNSIPGVLR